MLMQIASLAMGVTARLRVAPWVDGWVVFMVHGLMVASTPLLISACSLGILNCGLGVCNVTRPRFFTACGPHLLVYRYLSR